MKSRLVIDRISPLIQPPVTKLDEDLAQLDALLACYRKLAPQLAYYRAANEVADVKHQVKDALSQGEPLEPVERQLAQELYDLAWAIHDCPGGAPLRKS